MSRTCASTRGWPLALVALLGAALFPAGGAAEALLPEPEPTEYEPDEVAGELDRFEAVGDGIVLTLAACEQEPHCVTAMSEHELARLIDRIHERVTHLREVDEAEGLEPPYNTFLERYLGLRERYADYLQEVRVVTVQIDADALDEAWEDLLDFTPEALEIDEGPTVPSPNDQITLDRFQDIDEPMPID